jgi:hypothetical protein
VTERRWTTDDVMAFLGLGSRESARDWLSTHGIQATGRQSGRSGLNEYDEDDVRAAAAKRPGQGVGGGRPRKPAGEL